MGARLGADPASLEGKIVRAYESARAGLAPWEIAEITHRALAQLPKSLQTDAADILFDLIYEAISEALEKAQNS